MRIHIIRNLPAWIALAIMAGWAGLTLVQAVPADSANASGFSPVLEAKDADGAWLELQKSTQPPPAPAAWHETAPTTQERAKFYIPFIDSIEGKAKDFYTRFPGSTNTGRARLLEFRFVTIAGQLGDSAQKARGDAMKKDLPRDPHLTGESHFQALWMVAQSSEPEQARPLLQEIASGAAPKDLKDAATGQLRKMDALGKPMELQFTAVDGRPVDLAKLKGKVVLIDFWATWCGPCVGEVPNVKKTYDQFHPRGLEIIGISLDKEKSKLTDFTAEHGMAWPQYFDGGFWHNKYAVQFGIESIPSMWLVDKKGNLRTQEGREDLTGQVQKLLAE